MVRHSLFVIIFVSFILLSTLSSAITGEIDNGYSFIDGIYGENIDHYLKISNVNVFPVEINIFPNNGARNIEIEENNFILESGGIEKVKIKIPINEVNRFDVGVNVEFTSLENGESIILPYYIVVNSEEYTILEEDFLSTNKKDNFLEDIVFLDIMDFLTISTFFLLSILITLLHFSKKINKPKNDNT